MRESERERERSDRFPSSQILSPLSYFIVMLEPRLKTASGLESFHRGPVLKTGTTVELSLRPGRITSTRVSLQRWGFPLLTTVFLSIHRWSASKDGFGSELLSRRLLEETCRKATPHLPPLPLPAPSNHIKLLGAMGFWVFRILSVHVPEKYKLWPQCTCIGSTLTPKYILFAYMDPIGKNLSPLRREELRSFPKPTLAVVQGPTAGGFRGSFAPPRYSETL